MAQKKRSNKPIQIALTEDQIANIIREAARTRKGLKAESLEERIAPSRFGLPVFGGAEGGLPGPEGGDPLPGTDPGTDGGSVPGTDGGGLPGTVDGNPDLPEDPNLPQDPNSPLPPDDPNAPSLPPDDPNAPPLPGDPENPFDPNYLDPTNPPLPDPNEVFDPTLPPEPPLPEDPLDPNLPPEPLDPTQPPLPPEPLDPADDPGLVPPEPGDPVLPDDPVHQNFQDQIDRQLHEEIEQRLESGGDVPTPEEIEQHRQNIIRQLRGEG